MYKKIIFFIATIGLVTGLISPIIQPVYASSSVTIVEGGLSLDTLINDIEYEAKSVCDSQGGYLKISVPSNKFRFEIDEYSGQVAGLGKLVISFDQKCPGEAAAKLIKKTGNISASIVFSGIKRGDSIKGTYDLNLSIPALVTFNTSLRGQPWEAQISRNELFGSFRVSIDKFNFVSNFYFNLPLKQGQSKFISGTSVDQAKFKLDLSTALSSVGSSDFYVREKGVAKLDQIRSGLPFDAKPFKDIDPLPEVNALLDLFEGYIGCVQKNVDASTIGNKQWEKCLYTAGDILNRTELYVKEVKPISASAQFYIILAQSWDKMRYYSQFAPAKVKFDKVENCNRSKQMAYKAGRLDYTNKAVGDMLNKLNDKMGCEGMPLFGINSEQIAKDRQKAIDEAMKKILEIQADEAAKKQQEFNDKLEKAIEEIEEISEEKAEENTEEAVEENSKIFDDNFLTFLDFISKKSNNLPAKEKEKIQENIEDSKKLREELKNTKDEQKRKEAERKLKENMRAMEEANKELAEKAKADADAINMAKSVQNDLSNLKTMADLMEWMNKQKYFKNFDEFIAWSKTGRGLEDVFGGEYGKFDAFSDAAGMLASYLENREKYSHEDAALKSFMDGTGMMLLNKLPIIQAAELVAKGPATLGNSLLDMAGVNQDSELRLALKVWADTFSVSNALNEVTAQATSGNWTDWSRAMGHGWTKVGEAEGVVATTGAVVNAVTSNVAGTVVGAAKGIRDVFFYTGTGFGAASGWLVGRFTDW